MIVDEEDILEHTGVKGMKWGVRKNAVHKDPVLDRLYTRIGEASERGDLDKAMSFIDKIFERRVKIGDIDDFEDDDAWFDKLMSGDD